MIFASQKKIGTDFAQKWGLPHYSPPPHEIIAPPPPLWYNYHYWGGSIGYLTTKLGGYNGIDPKNGHLNTRFIDSWFNLLINQ